MNLNEELQAVERAIEVIDTIGGYPMSPRFREDAPASARSRQASVHGGGPSGARSRVGGHGGALLDWAEVAAGRAKRCAALAVGRRLTPRG